MIGLLFLDIISCIFQGQIQINRFHKNFQLARFARSHNILLHLFDTSKQIAAPAKTQQI